MIFTKLRRKLISLLCKTNNSVLISIANNIMPAADKQKVIDLVNAFKTSSVEANKIIDSIKQKDPYAHIWFTDEMIKEVVGGELTFNDAIINHSRLLPNNNIVELCERYAISFKSYSAIFEFFATITIRLERLGYWSLVRNAWTHPVKVSAGITENEINQAIAQLISVELATMLAADPKCKMSLDTLHAELITYFIP